MSIIRSLKQAALVGGAVAAIGGLGFSGIAQAATDTSSTSSTQSAESAAKQQQDLANIKAKGAAEITRRLSSLNTAEGKISSTTKLSSSDQAYLENEVTTEISGLTALQTKLASDTTVSSAIADAKSIFSEYRVYALVLPKVWLVATADNQQTTESKLKTLAGKLQVRITADQIAGKDTTTLQTELNDMTAKTSDAQAISSSIEQKVLTLQPSDYDSDRTILSGDKAQLNTAHSDNQAAYADAKNIVSGLEALK